MSQMFRVVSFEKFQHYRDRKPPWIKLYRDLWRDQRFFELSEVERYQLISIFVLASQNGNMLPVNQEWLKHELASSKPIALNKLVATGWIQIVEHVASNPLSASSPIAVRQQDAIVETEVQKYRSTEGETEGEVADAIASGAPPPVPILNFGEFGYARMTQAQHDKLRAELNGKLAGYIRRFDCWVNEAPNAKQGGVRRQDRHAYESIIAWSGRDGDKHGGKQTHEHESREQAKVRRVAAAAGEALNFMHGDAGNGTGSRDHEGANYSLPETPFGLD